MTEADVGAVLRDAMMVILKLGGPLLVAGLVVGVVIAMLQAATQINDASLIFVPKLLALAAVLAVLGPFMLAVLGAFTTHLFDRIIAIGGT